MDDRTKAFLDELKLELAGFPENEIKEAMEYYEEYISDALEEGKSAEEILSRLDPAVKIAAMIKAETSIRKAQNNPGLKNYSKVLKYAYLGITRPFSILMFSLFIFTTYSIALLLFLGAIASAAAACVVISAFIYEAVKIPSIYISEIIGTVSSGIFSAAVCMLSAIGFYKLCRLFIQLSSGLVGRMLNKSHKSTAVIHESQEKRKSNSGLPLKICLVTILASLLITLVSGLPTRLFTIFNSMDPVGITVQEWEYDAASVKKIRIETAHTNIRLEKGNSDKIEISYGQPDWLEPETICKDGQLTFSEKSNGRLPLFSFISLHENSSEIIISLPEGFAPEALEFVSRGGFVYIDSASFNITVKTYTGNIYLEPGSGAKPAAITAATSTGIIQSAGANVGVKTADGQEYKISTQDSNSIILETIRGSIFINYIE